MAKIDKDPIVLHIINYYKNFYFSISLDWGAKKNNQKIF